MGDRVLSEETIRRYMARYATPARLGRPVTEEDVARIFDGGPNGYKNGATRQYWENLKRYL